MNNSLKSIPKFSSENEEFEFWATHDATEYFDLSKAVVITEPNSFPNLKRTQELIPIMLDKIATLELKEIAKERSVDLTTLALQYVREGLQRDGHHSAAL